MQNPLAIIAAGVNADGAPDLAGGMSFMDMSVQTQ